MKNIQGGYDENKKLLFIKPLTKSEVLRGDIPEHARYNISINTSYGRITNKAFILKVANLFNLDLKDKGIKFKGQWISNQNMLEVSLKEVL